MRKRLISAIASIFAFGAVLNQASAQEIVVGGKAYTEQLVLASMTSQYLKHLGYSVSVNGGMGSSVLRQAQESGQVDIYWEYTGTSLITYNKVADKLGRDETYQKVKSLDAAKGLTWLDPSRINSTYGIALRKADAEALGISTLSALADKVNSGEKLTFASNAEFYARPDGLRPLEKAYGFEFGRANIVRMDTGLIYQALRDKQVDAGVIISTDGRIPAFELKVLADDKGYFPSYAATPVVRTETLEKNPKLSQQMNAISALLTDDIIAGLNANVDVDKKTVDDVAKGFLVQNKLIQ